jgi:hypothetical protein
MKSILDWSGGTCKKINAPKILVWKPNGKEILTWEVLQWDRIFVCVYEDWHVLENTLYIVKKIN